MATKRQIRRAQSGWVAVFFVGCDTDSEGNANRVTAKRIVKEWRATRDAAEQVTTPPVEA